MKIPVGRPLAGLAFPSGMEENDFCSLHLWLLVVHLIIQIIGMGDGSHFSRILFPFPDLDESHASRRLIHGKAREVCASFRETLVRNHRACFPKGML